MVGVVGDGGLLTPTSPRNHPKSKLQDDWSVQHPTATTIGWVPPSKHGCMLRVVTISPGRQRNSTGVLASEAVT